MARHNRLCKRKQQILEDSFLAIVIPITSPFQYAHAIRYILCSPALPLDFKKIIFYQEVAYYV
jgi:hypothetical protein